MKTRWLTIVAAATTVVALVALLPVLSGAARGNSDGAQVTVRPSTSAAPTTDAEAQQQQAAFVARSIADLKSQTTPEQLPAFADDHIDQAEYEAAIHGSIACLTDAGITVQPPIVDGWRLVFTFNGDPDRAANRKLLDIYDACYIKYTRDIDAAWAGENARVLTVAQEDQASKEIVACLQARGATLSANAPKADWWAVRDSNPPAFGDCANAIQAKFGALP